MKGKKVWEWILTLLITSFLTSTLYLVTVYASETTLFADPEVSIIDFGESVTIEVNIEDVFDLFSYEIKLDFNGDVLEVVTIEEGPFLKEGTTSPSGTLFVANIFNDYLHVTCTTIGDYPGVDGDGNLFEVTFVVKPAGTLNAGISSLGFPMHACNSTSFPPNIPHSTVGGVISTMHTNLCLEPSSIVDPTLVPSSTFKADIMVSDVPCLYDWQVNMSFSPNVLKAVDIVEGDFLKSQPEGTFGAKIIRNDKGWAMFGWTTIGAYIGVRGSGILATVEFEVLAIGESVLKFVNQTEALGYTFLEAQTKAVAPPKWVYNPFMAENGYFNNLGAVVAPSTVDFEPDVLNPKSKGRWIKAYLELREDFDVSDVDISTVRLNGEIPAELRPAEIGDYDEDSIPDLMVKFDRAKVISLLNGCEATLAITGELLDGTPFEGTDTIKVIG